MRLRLAIAALLLMHVPFLFPGFFAPYDFAEQHRAHPYAPPARLRFFDAYGRFYAWPFVYKMEQDYIGGPYSEVTARQYPLQLFRNGHLLSVEAPGDLFLAGTDGLGRDIFSRLLYGGLVSIAAGIAAALVALGLGLAAGIAAGLYGGWTDKVLMRGGELFLALPWLYLLLAARAFLPLHITPLQAFALLVTIIGTVGWVRPARVIRGVVMSVRERPFVEAARGFGASHRYLMRRHILPLTVSVAATQATILIPRFLLAEVTLSFLGLGVGEPVPSWGNLLAEARQFHALVSHPWVMAPGLAAIPLLFGYLKLADLLVERSAAAEAAAAG
jgi:peptide/nickel transport system permease protein